MSKVKHNSKKNLNNKNFLNSFLNHFHNSFFSHKKNNFTPHLFRNASLFTLLLLAVFLLGASYGSRLFFSQTVLGASIAANVLVDLTNQDRLAMDIPLLRVNKKLNDAAMLKVNDMIRKSYFSHNSPEGLTPWYFIQKAGYNFLYAGENLAINFQENREVEVAWMNSPLHRENLLNVKFEEVGIAATAGKKDGKDTVFIVQMFGTPARMLTINNPHEQKIDNKINTKTEILSENKSITYRNKEDNKIGQVAGVETYSTLWDRIFFNSPMYIQIIFFIIIFMLSLGLLFLLFTEYHKHHYRHIVLGLSVISILGIFIYFNSTII